MAGLYPTDFRMLPTAPERPLQWNCRAVRRALWALLDGELSAHDVADLYAHRQVCAACAMEFTRRQALHQVLRQAGAACLDDLARRRILARVAAARQGRKEPSERPTAIVRPGPGK